MRTLTIYAFTLIVACFIVCCTAGPSEIDDDSVIGGHDNGDCCEYDNPVFCGHAVGGCPPNTNINKCQKNYGEARCDDNGSGTTPCDVDYCQNRSEEPELCSTDPYT